MKHIYQTTREVENSISFVDHTGRRITSHDVTMTRKASKYVFRGGKRAFVAHLEMLNTEHGAGYAVPVAQQPITQRLACTNLNPR